MAEGQAHPQLRLSLMNNRDACETARLAVVNFLASYQADAAAVFSVELILEEALMNAINHGQLDHEHFIKFRLELQPAAIVLSFEDNGIAFDPTQPRLPELPKLIEMAAPGGLGLRLIRQYAESVAYERTQECNRLTVAVART